MSTPNANSRPSPSSSTLLDLLENVIAAQFEAGSTDKAV